MTASISEPLNQQQVATATSQSQQIGSSSTQVITSNKFVFFAAFDGTDNIRTNPGYAGTPQTTNVGQMAYQVEAQKATSGGNLQVGYYPGPGTPGTLPGSSISPTQQMQATANKAYNDFAEQAKIWLASPNPDGTARSAADITTAITGFSRGAPTGVIFAQLLNERGLVAANGTVLIAPGQTSVAAMLLIDPVSTGYEGSLAIPGNVNSDNITVIRAQNEFRYKFAADDYSNDWRVQTIDFAGNHGDAGGFYDRGLSALSLQGSTAFFKNAGLPIADVPNERAFAPNAPVVIHNEGVDSFGNVIWSEYGTVGNRLTKKIDPPVLSNSQDPNVQSVTIEPSTYPGDDTSTRIITYKDGRVIEQLMDGDGHVIMTADADEQFSRDAVTGVYNVIDPSTQVTRSYNLTSQELTYTSPTQGSIVVDRDGAVLRITPPASPTAAPTTEVEGENYYVAANGAFYKVLPDGKVVMRDCFAKAGVICNQSANGTLTPVATFDTDYSLNSGSTTTTRNLQNELIQTTTRQTDDDGNVLQITTNADGSGTAKTYNDLGQEIASASFTKTGDINGTSGTLTEEVNGKSVVFDVNFDGGGGDADNDGVADNEEAGYDLHSSILLKGVDSIDGQAATDGTIVDAAFAADNFQLSDLWTGPDAVFAPTGALTELIVAADPTDSDGWQAAPVTGDAPWYESEGAQQLGGTLSDVQGLIAALKSGKPLPIATLVFNLAATVSRNAELSSISQGLSTLNSLSNFTDALQRGDELAALSSGASFVNNVYIEFYKGTVMQGIEALGGISAARALADMGDEAAGELVQTFDVFQDLSDALPYLNLINAVANGDVAGTAVALADIAGVPYIGWAYAAYSILSSLFSDPPDIHGSAVASSSQDGRHVHASITDNSEGGGNTAASVMANLITGLESTFADTVGMGIIAQRLPSLYFKGYSGGGYFNLSFHDAQTGQTYVRNYSMDGDFMGEGPAGASSTEIANSEDFFKGMGAQFAEAAYKAGAVAPQWMVKTVDAQAARGDGLAGLTTEQRAAALGQLLATNPGDATPGNAGNNNASSTQTARLIALDEIDANGDGKLNASDFAFDYLQVWQDINHDGQVQGYELANTSQFALEVIAVCAKDTRAGGRFGLRNTPVANDGAWGAAA